MQATISITRPQYDTIKAMFGACSHDCTRSCLNRINYDAKAKQLCATDGHIMRFETMDLGETDVQISDAIPFTLSATAIKREYPHWVGENTIDVVCTWPDGEEYPQYSKVIPSPAAYKAYDNAPLIGLDLNQIARFAKTTPDKRLNSAVFVPTSDISAVLVYKNHNGYQLVGLIMPIRTNGLIQHIQDESVAATHEQAIHENEQYDVPTDRPTVQIACASVACEEMTD